MVKLKNLLLKEIAAAMEWKDVPQDVKDEAYKLVAEHNRGIDPSIKGFYYIDVTGKYQVYYTFWRYKEVDPRFAGFIHNPIYMGNLTTDVLTAVKKAIERMPKTVRLDLVTDETRKNLIGKTGKVMKFTFGKYRGRSLPEVYLENPGYFAFLAKNADPQYANTKMAQAIQFFSDMYFEETRQKNLAQSTSQYIGQPNEPYEGELEVYGVNQKTGAFGPYISYKMKDEAGNKFLAINLEKSFPNVKQGDKIKVKAKIKKHLELLGVKFTALAYIKPA